MKKITNLEQFCFYFKDSVFKAMEKLNNKDVSFLIITNKKKELLGTITDGDIRRHILKGRSLHETIAKAMKKNQYSVMKIKRVLIKKSYFQLKQL